MQIPRRNVFTCFEVGELIGRSAPSVYRDAQLGLIESLKMGGQVRIPREALLAYLQRNKRKAKKPPNGSRSS